MNWFHKHKWTKWEQYDQAMTYFKTNPPTHGTDRYQKRRCEDCGYEQRKEVNAY